jgi:hypothetical protein
MIDWITDDINLAIMEGTLDEDEGAVIRVYIDDFVRSNAGMMESASGFVRYFNQTNLLGLEISPQKFDYLWKKYLKRVHKRLSDDPPKWFTDLSDVVFLDAAQRGRGKFARNKAAAERKLRNRLIRLAHTNPALRPHLLPLLKQAGCEKLPEALRANCEKKQDEGDKGEDKKASLRSSR